MPHGNAPISGIYRLGVATPLAQHVINIANQKYGRPQNDHHHSQA